MLMIRSLALAVVACATIALSANAQTLKWGAEQDIGSLDPYSYGSSFTINVLNNVYEGLVRFNRDLKIEPALAVSWEILDDQITWRFHLRKGVSFHNGKSAEPVRALCCN